MRLMYEISFSVLAVLIRTSGLQGAKHRQASPKVFSAKEVRDYIPV